MGSGTKLWQGTLLFSGGTCRATLSKFTEKLQMTRIFQLIGTLMTPTMAKNYFFATFLFKLLPLLSNSDENKRKSATSGASDWSKLTVQPDVHLFINTLSYTLVE